MISLFLRQTWTLIEKNLLVGAVRRPISTLIRAILLPLTIILVVAYSQYFFNPNQRFGVGHPSPILSLPDAISHAGAGRDTVVFVDSGFSGGDISAVIDEVSSPFRHARKKVIILNNQSDVDDVCVSSERGSSNCFAAAIFISSATEPKISPVWNYTLRADESLGGTVNVDSHYNDAQVFLLPLQAAIDRAILERTSNSNKDAISEVRQYPYTTETEKKHEEDNRLNYLNRCINVFTVIFFLGLVSVVYQLTRMMASEREHGLTQLLEVMMPSSTSRQPQTARFIAYHGAFSIIYGPSWLAAGIVLAIVVFKYTAAATIIMYHLTIGLALCSFSILGASFFNSSQVCAITVTIIAVVTAVIPQVLPSHSQTPATVTALCMLFPSANYVYFLITALRFELWDLPANLSETPRHSQWNLTGQQMWCFLILQILLYPMLAACVEKLLYGTASSNRDCQYRPNHGKPTVQVRNLCKTYRKHWLLRFWSQTQDVKAVTDLSLDAHKGQILMLLGPNGSGKSTTLDAIAGLSKLSSGSIELDGTNGLGIAPQKNVLWDDLTVAEHVRILYRLKTSRTHNSKFNLDSLIEACDLKHKKTGTAKSLSGGQKRKLQLAMMFAGGSAVCCVDEVSSGLDPLSRRKIWDILLAERGDRTIIMTTHFLDEADFLSDHIVILSKGKLQAEGSSAGLKHSMGDGYTVTAPLTLSPTTITDIPGIQRKQTADHIVYTQLDSAHTARVANHLDQCGIETFSISGPTLEDVFLKLTGTSIEHDTSRKSLNGIMEKNEPLDENCLQELDFKLDHGRPVSALRQLQHLFVKRCIVLRSSYMPYVGAIIVSLIGSGVCPLFLKHFEPMQCAIPNSTIVANYFSTTGYVESLATMYGTRFVGGPTERLLDATLSNLANIYSPNNTLYGSEYGVIDEGFQNVSTLRAAIQPVSTVPDFMNSVATDSTGDDTVTLRPGAFWLGDDSSPPYFAWAAENWDISTGIMMQNVVNNLLTNSSIFVGFANFDVPAEPDLYSFLALLFIIYFALVFCVYPGFFAIYPTRERLRSVRGLQFSNGVRSLPTWLSHLAFDSIFILLISALSTILLSAGTHLWYHVAYLFLVLVLYGTSSTILGYMISLLAKSHLGALAFLVGGQVVMLLAYFGAYLAIQSNTNVAGLQLGLNKIHFSIALFSPSANLLRALFVSLNQFLINCGRESNPGQIELYGGPILYLTLQTVVLFCVLLCMDSRVSLLGSPRSFGRNKPTQPDTETIDSASPETLAEMYRVRDADSGLRVSHLSKRFKKNQALDDVTFGVQAGEIFALLGPNGAGKSKRHALATTPYQILIHQ